MNFNWDKEKNNALKKERGLCFEDVISVIHEDKVIDMIKHPNKEKYPNQSIFIVELFGYICMVPFVKNDNQIFLKTIIPSRKLNKIYRKGSS